MFPNWVWAISRCPPEAGEKSKAFVILGFAILGVFVALGVLVRRAMLRLARDRPAWARTLLAMAAYVLMLGCWLLGVSIFWMGFVLTC